MYAIVLHSDESKDKVVALCETKFDAFQARSEFMADSPSGGGYSYRVYEMKRVR